VSMASCDFGSPCDCSECRTRKRQELCPQCGFRNVVALLGSAEQTYDRKGVRGYDVTYPDGPPKELVCRACGAVSTVPHYTSVDEQGCRAALETIRLERDAKPCDGCGRRSEFSFSGPVPVRLQQHRDVALCEECLAERLKKESPDPSDGDNRYTFNKRTLQWTISKVRVACADCGRFRWLNAENRWKRLCSTCFRTDSASTERQTAGRRRSVR
jgi:hypothetical protein